MSRNSALASTVALLGLSGLLLCDCSDPSPPSAAAALSTTVSTSGTCSSSRGPLSVGEDSGVLTSTYPGTKRVTDGEGGSVVRCTVKKTETGFTIDASIEADAIEKNETHVNYHQNFTLTSTYVGFVKGMPATASVGAFDTVKQFNAADANCTLNVTSFGNDGNGGALLATFSCPMFKDPNTPSNVCTFTGILALENCAK